MTVPEIGDDSQLTLLTTISVLGDSTSPFFVSKNKTSEKDMLPELEMYEGHDYTIRTAPKTLMAEFLFIDWLQTFSLLSVETRRQQVHYDGPVVFLLDGHTTHATPRIIASAGSERIIIIQLLAHS
jgi:hypothetical protein